MRDLGQHVAHHHAEAGTHHEAHAQAGDNGLCGGHIPQAQPRTSHDDAHVGQKRTTKPEGDGSATHQKSDGEHHGRVVQAKGHAGNGQLEEHGGNDTQHVTRHAPYAGKCHRSRQLEAGGTACFTRFKRLSCGNADGILQARVLHQALADERRAYKAQQRPCQCHQHHLYPAHVVGQAQHPDAGDGKGKASCHHGARRHDDLRHICLVEAPMPKGTQKHKGRNGGEDGGPGQCAHLERGID